MKWTFPGSTTAPSVGSKCLSPPFCTGTSGARIAPPTALAVKVLPSVPQSPIWEERGNVIGLALALLLATGAAAVVGQILNQLDVNRKTRQTIQQVLWIVSFFAVLIMTV